MMSNNEPPVISSDMLVKLAHEKKVLQDSAAELSRLIKDKITELNRVVVEPLPPPQPAVARSSSKPGQAAAVEQKSATGPSVGKSGVFAAPPKQPAKPPVTASAAAATAPKKKG